jgi:ABC-type nitrate/sulfonate/bicarbonate transport system substrate-binding protein
MDPMTWISMDPLSRAIARSASPLLILLVLVVGISCGDDAPAELDSVVFMAGFKAQANLPFVAAYVAQEQGYFEEQGLAVEIKHAGSGEHLKLLMSGDVDFTTAAASSVLKRRSDPELPIVAFALFGQRGQQAYIALGDSGISTLSDWETKTFGYKVAVPPDYLAMLKASGVDPSKITEVNAGFDPRVLTERKVDILAVFKSNEPDTLRRMGFEVTSWEPESYGVPNLGLTYITRQQMADDKPDLIRRFLKATLKGVQFAFDNTEETLDIVLEYAPMGDREHQRFMLETELTDAVSALTQDNGLGWMTEAQWKALYDMLLEFEALPNAFDYRTAYSDRFLREVYEGGELRWP